MARRSFVWQLLASVLALLLWIEGAGSIRGGPSAIAAPQASGAIADPQGTGLPATAMFVPREAPLMVSLMGKSNQLSDWFGTRPALKTRQPSAIPLNQIPQTLLASAGIDYHAVIQPWVDDEISFALTSFDLDGRSNNGRQPGYLLVFPTRSSKENDAFLERFWQQQTAGGQTLTFEQYQGVGVVSKVVPSTSGPIAVQAPASLAEIPPLKSLAVAVVEQHYVLVANSAQVIHAVIDTIQSPELKLTNDQNYQQAVSTLEQEKPAGFAFVNLAALSSELGNFRQPSVQAFNCLALTLNLWRQGILAETALVAGQQAQGEPITPRMSRAIRALDYIPASSPFVATGINLNQLWTQLNHDLSGYKPLAQWVNQSLARAGQRWGLNLPQDIFPGVDGEYALAMLPQRSYMQMSDQALQSTADMDWLFVHEQTQTSPAQQLSQRLNQLAEQQGIGVSPFFLDSQPVSAWTQIVNPPTHTDATAMDGKTILSAELTGAYTSVKDHKILATSLDALEQGLTAHDDALAKQQDFQAAIAALDQPNQGYLYLDWPIMGPILKQQFPGLRQLEQLAPRLFKQLQSLIVSRSGHSPQVIHSQFLLRL